MQISKKEKRLLIILGFVLVGFLYYQFGYQALTSIVDTKKEEREEIENKYNNAINTINEMGSKKSKVKILNAKIADEASPLYPTLSQEHIILELDKLIKDSGLEGGMTFEKVEVSAVGEIKKSSEDKGLAESSIQNLADKYNNKYGEKNKDDNEASGVSEAKNGKEEIEKQDSTNADNKGNSESTTNSNAKKTTKEDTVTHLKLNIDFNGSYQSVIKFLSALRTYERKIPSYAINMSTKNLAEVKGSVNMVIYVVPKIDNDISKYLTWNLKNTYGKGQPFNIGSAAGTGIKSVNNSSDFMVSANSINSEIPTVIIGRADDTLRTSYAYGDGNNEQSAEIVLTQKDGKYYYKYKTAMSHIPSNYDGLGSEFRPNGDNIAINVLSQSRVDSDDKSGLKLKIINNTDKQVKVDISGEDAADPRVSIDGDSEKITVNKK